MPQPLGGQRRGRRRWLPACCAAGAVALGVALPASAQTLTEAFAYAYNNNPQLLAQRAALRATDESVPQALANWRPTVNFTGSAGRTRAGVEEPGANTATTAALGTNPCNGPVGTTCSTPTQFSNFTSRSVDLRVTQPLYRGGRTEAQTRQAINTVQATRGQTLAVETSVFQAVAQAYLDTVRDQTLVE